MDKKYIEIENNKDFAREVSSKAIINNNKNALEQAKLSRERRLEQEKRIQNLESSMGDIQNKLEIILGLLGKDGNTNR